MAGSRVSFGGLLQAAAAATVVFSLATFAGPLHHAIDLFAHFRWQYLLAAIVLAPLLALTGSRRWALAMLAVTVVNAVPVVQWYRQPAEAVAVSPARLRLLLSNVYSGNPESAPLLDLIRRERPDVVVLQEVDARRMKALAPLGADYPYRRAVPRDDNFGIALLSRLPLDGPTAIESPPFGFPTLLVDVEVGGRPVTIIATHTLPPLGRTGFDAQAEQLASIADLAASLSGPRIVVGDLNTTMWGQLYRKLIDRSGLRNARQGRGLLPTWPAPLAVFGIPIDHCLVSADVVVADLRSGPNIGSDHLPLIADLEFIVE